MCKGYGSHHVCLFVCYHANCYISHYKSKMRYHRVLCGVFKIYTVWILLKMLGSKVLAYHRWQTSSRRTGGTAMDSLLDRKCARSSTAVTQLLTLLQS